MAKKIPAAVPDGTIDRAAKKAGKAAGGTIRVMATAVGFYDDIRRRIGDVFDLHPRTGTFTKLVLDKDGKPELNHDALVKHRVTEEADDVTLTAAQQFNKKWMVKVAADTPERAGSAREVIQQEHDAILRERLAGSSTAPTASGDAQVLG